MHGTALACSPSPPRCSPTTRTARQTQGPLAERRRARGGLKRGALTSTMNRVFPNRTASSTWFWNRGSCAATTSSGLDLSCIHTSQGQRAVIEHRGQRTTLAHTHACPRQIAAIAHREPQPVARRGGGSQPADRTHHTPLLAPHLGQVVLQPLGGGRGGVNDERHLLREVQQHNCVLKNNNTHHRVEDSSSSDSGTHIVRTEAGRDDDPSN
jgi:hypothetical protein